MLHSLIVVHPRGITVEAFAPSPDLLVNGEKRRSVTLRHHDRIEIGRIELRFHNPAEVHPQPAPFEGVPDEVSLEDPSLESPVVLTTDELARFAPTPAGDLSLDALVDRLEEERQAAVELAQRRAAGAAALIDAIQRASEAEDTEPAAAAAAEPESEAIPLQTIDAELEERERQLLALEETLAARAAGLALVQDRLVEQIGQIREQVRQLEGPGDSEPLRISA